MSCQTLDLTHIHLQLSYQMTAGVLIGNLASLPLVLCRYLLGPMPSAIFHSLVLFRSGYLFHMFVIGFEVNTLKFISVVVLEHMPSILDDFMARFFTVANVGVGLILAMLNSFTAHIFIGKLRFLGLPTFLSQNINELTFKYEPF